MDANVSSVTLEDMKSVLNITNFSDSSDVKNVYDLFEDYRVREKEFLLTYHYVAYGLGALIILSNLTVVISSGLILKKGQQPKSTYLLLGNVSLADTLLGFSLILGNFIKVNSNVQPDNSTLCIFHLGTVVCPTMVSLFSVGFIAIDRYIYILHGLYYQRWINATRVRIGIAIIWIFGLILGFLPATGWTNTHDYQMMCYYTTVFPVELIIFNAVISLIPPILVAVLYSFILKRALNKVSDIKSEKSLGNIRDSTNFVKLRINRGNLNNNKIMPSIPVYKKSMDGDFISTVNKSASAPTIAIDLKSTLDVKSNMISNMHKETNDLTRNDNNGIGKNRDNNIKNEPVIQISISSIDTELPNSTTASTASLNQCKSKCKQFRENLTHKKHECCKSRAIVVVLLTTGSFLITNVPFFCILLVYVHYCQDMFASEKCARFRALYLGPLTTIVFTNSILNPLIYAWWHKGFKKAVRSYIKQYCDREKFKAAFRKK